jgi:alginate O-acetyltransferase complex protein AlgI
VNLAVVMLLGGLWHGAKWNFILWGGYHGLLLGCERWRGKQSLYQALPAAARIGLTFLLMLFSWVLFRADNLTAARRYYAAMFGVGPVADTAPLIAAGMYTPYHLLVLAVCAGLVFQPLQAHDWARQPQSWGRAAMLTPLFAVSVVVMFSQAFNPFLYFQF